MAGFDPVGSTPVGAIGTVTPAGTVFQPGAGKATFAGSTVSLTGSTALISAVEVSQLFVEALTPSLGVSEGRFSQLFVELLVPGIAAGASDDDFVTILW